MNVLAVAAVAAVVAIGAPHAAMGQEETAMQLLTPEEAEKLCLADEEWDRQGPFSPERSRGSGKPPLIVVEKPTVEDTPKGLSAESPTPVDFLVLFERQDAAVDMTTLRVYFKKFFLKQDVTDEASGHVVGTTLKGRVPVPPGKYNLFFEVSDVDGRRTKERLRLRILKTE